MVPAGRLSAESGSTEERILENRKAFSKPLRPFKVAWRLSVISGFWGYTSFGCNSLARDHPLRFCLFQGTDSARFLLSGGDGSQTQVEVFIQMICLDYEGRKFRFDVIVVNIANVGNYGRREDKTASFSWDYVRQAIASLTKGCTVIGVCKENLTGPQDIQG